MYVDEMWLHLMSKESWGRELGDEGYNFLKNSHYCIRLPPNQRTGRIKNEENICIGINVRVDFFKIQENNKHFCLLGTSSHALD